MTVNHITPSTYIDGLIQREGGAAVRARLSQQLVRVRQHRAVGRAQLALGAEAVEVARFGALVGLPRHARALQRIVQIPSGGHNINQQKNNNYQPMLGHSVSHGMPNFRNIAC